MGNAHALNSLKESNKKLLATIEDMELLLTSAREHNEDYVKMISNLTQRCLKLKEDYDMFKNKAKLIAILTGIVTVLTAIIAVVKGLPT